MLGFYTISNCLGLGIVSIDGDEVEVRPVTSEKVGETEICPITDDYEGFMWGEMFVPFSECIRLH